MVEPIFSYQFRLILIGDSTVGKSSVLKYFTDGKFASGDCEPTVGIDFYARLVEVKPGVRVKLQVPMSSHILFCMGKSILTYFVI